MSSNAAFPQSTRPNLPPDLKAWWPVFLGLLVLYVPTYWTLAAGSWQIDQDTHGPIVLAVVLFLLWQKRGLLGAEPDRFAHGSASILDSVVGWTSLVVGVCLYIIGRSQDIQLLEVGSQIPVLLGLLLIMQGRRTAIAFWFPLFFLLFIIPLPGFVVAAATTPLKSHVSQVAENILYFFHYPIARNGVVLTIGSYQLLIANACSGLGAVFSLTALGLLYIYVVGNTSWLRNAILIASILPIAFIANTVRVVVLALITYYWGPEAIAGFLHPLAGVVLFNVAVLLMFALDVVLGYFLPNRSSRSAARDGSNDAHGT
ncbi:MAG: exosortase B [Acidobacteriaceae bacterium]